MQKLKRVWKILKVTDVDKMLLGFLCFIFFTSLIIMLVEPTINQYGDALWYAFTVVTTIGFGDFYAVTLIGRICSILLGVYGILVVALIPGVLVSYYLDFVQRKADDTVGIFLEKLENLEHLPKEELREISKKIKQHRYGTENSNQ